jgi:hypothetical protein
VLAHPPRQHGNSLTNNPRETRYKRRAQIIVEKPKKPLDIMSYKLYYVNYEMRN